MTRELRAAAALIAGLSMLVFAQQQLASSPTAGEPPRPWDAAAARSADASPGPTPATAQPADTRRTVGQLQRGKPMDLNLAGPEALRLLPRIGPSLAARIVADRGQHGPFGSVDELMRVPGIGARTVEQIRPWVQAGQGASAAD